MKSKKELIAKIEFKINLLNYGQVKTEEMVKEEKKLEEKIEDLYALEEDGVKSK